MKYFYFILFLLSSTFIYANTPVYQSPDQTYVQPSHFFKMSQSRSETEQLYQHANVYLNRHDFSNAFALYHQSATKNYAPAQYQLGMMFRHGIGIRQNDDYAKYWIKKSAQNRYTLAVEIYNAFYAKKAPVSLQRYARN